MVILGAVWNGRGHESVEVHLTHGDLANLDAAHERALKLAESVEARHGFESAQAEQAMARPNAILRLVCEGNLSGAAALQDARLAMGGWAPALRRVLR